MIWHRYKAHGQCLQQFQKCMNWHRYKAKTLTTHITIHQFIILSFFHSNSRTNLQMKGGYKILHVPKYFMEDLFMNEFENTKVTENEDAQDWNPDLMNEEEHTTEYIWCCCGKDRRKNPMKILLLRQNQIMRTNPQKLHRMMIHRIEKFNVLHVEIFPNSVTGS